MVVNNAIIILTACRLCIRIQKSYPQHQSMLTNLFYIHKITRPIRDESNLLLLELRRFKWTPISTLMTALKVTSSLPWLIKESRSPSAGSLSRTVPSSKMVIEKDTGNVSVPFSSVVIDRVELMFLRSVKQPHWNINCTTFCLLNSIHPAIQNVAEGSELNKKRKYTVTMVFILHHFLLFPEIFHTQKT